MSCLEAVVGVVLEFLGAVVEFMFHSRTSTLITAAVLSVGCLGLAQYLMSEPKPRRAKRKKRGRRRGQRRTRRSGRWMA